MRTYKQALLAGASFDVSGGKGLFVLSSSSVVDILFISESGKTMGLATDIPTNSKFSFSSGFGRAKITSPGAQTVGVVVFENGEDFEVTK